MYADEKALPEAPVQLEPWRQNLLKAAQYIRDHGWCQGKIVDAKGRVCLVGAIKKAKGVPLQAPVFNYPSEFKAISVLVGSSPGLWNDASMRSKEEVISVLEQAAYLKL